MTKPSESRAGRGGQFQKLTRASNISFSITRVLLLTLHEGFLSNGVGPYYRVGQLSSDDFWQDTE
jgi:hypothetical protein